MKKIAMKAIVTKAIVIGAFAAAALVAAPTPSKAQFYQGKRLTILVNYAAGGPTDIEARVLARHIGKHLDGVATVIVQNMDGAAGLTGRNYLGEIAPKDGTMVGYFTGTAFQYANDSRQHRVDYRTYDFVAYQPGTSVYFMRTDVKPGMKTAADLMKAENLVSGGLGPDNAKDLLLRITLDLLGVNYKYVTGYKGSQGARLALQTGEINYYSESPPSYRGVIEPSLVAKGEVIPTYYDPNFDGEKFVETTQMRGLDIKSFPEFFQQVKGRMPEGELWEVYKRVIALNGAMQRMVVLPPNSPPEAVAALRAAVRKLNDDKSYEDDAIKTFGFGPEWTAHDGVADHVRRTLVLPQPVKDFIHAYIKNAPKGR
jgi:tripartite-type tricarboxylate transporter receptor subunit TctC